MAFSVLSIDNASCGQNATQIPHPLHQPLSITGNLIIFVSLSIAYFLSHLKVLQSTFLFASSPFSRLLSYNTLCEGKQKTLFFTAKILCMLNTLW